MMEWIKNRLKATKQYILKHALTRWAVALVLGFGLSYLIWAFIINGFSWWIICTKEWSILQRLCSVLFAAALFLVINSRLAPDDE